MSDLPDAVEEIMRMRDPHAAYELLLWATKHNQTSVANKLREFIEQHFSALFLPIEELYLIAAVQKALKREGVHCIGDLITKTEAIVIGYRGIKVRGLKNIKQRLWWEYKLTLAGSAPPE